MMDSECKFIQGDWVGSADPVNPGQRKCTFSNLLISDNRN